MKKKDLEKFRKILLDEKKKILQHLESLSDSAVEDLAAGNVLSGDPADQAALEINQANLQKIGKREQFLLKKIELALKKVDAGTYGECENCGEDIAPARLMARAVAQLCIDCKTEQESMERRFSAGDGESASGESGMFEDGDEE